MLNAAAKYSRSTDSWCYLPLLAFLTFDREQEQYLCAAVLRPGNVPATKGAIGILARLLPLLRSAYPRAYFLVRLDGGFATPALFDFLDAEPVVAMAKNAVLARHAEPALDHARAESTRTGRTAHVYAETCYAAATWSDARRVVIKAEVVRLDDREPRDNPRFVVTNLRHAPRYLYERVYCARGDIENRIKELLDGLCSSTAPAAAASGQPTAGPDDRRHLRPDAGTATARRGTACARTQVTWLRDRLLKLGAHVVVSVRRMVFAPAAQHTGPRRLAAYCPRPRCPHRIETPPPQPPSRASNTAARRRLGIGVVKEPRFYLSASRPPPIHGRNAVTIRGAALGRADQGSDRPVPEPFTNDAG